MFVADNLDALQADISLRSLQIKNTVVASIEPLAPLERLEEIDVTGSVVEKSDKATVGCSSKMKSDALKSFCRK